jgi:O-antigen ligase
MTERIPKSLMVAGAGFAALVLAFVAFSRPGYFTNQSYLAGLILIEFLIAAIWFYQRVFFPVIIVAFLLAGVDLPVGAVWTEARWLFLAVGALVGTLILLKDRGYHFGLFHAVASFAVLGALVSATVSRYPGVALLKVLSVFLLFLYGGTGARVAVIGRENRFFTGLLMGCEIFVGATAAFHLVGIEVMGNPNSLGAVMAVVAAPLLLWGVLVEENPRIRRRRGALFALCMYLELSSHSRAGLAAAFCACGLLCLALRKYKMFVEGVIILIILLAATAIFRPEVITSMTSSVLYKGSSSEQGILASRQSPWKTAIESIKEHPWFGTGLGTTAEESDPAAEQGKYASNTGVTTENGSSYLSILHGVGVLGSIPYFLLLMLLMGRIIRTLIVMRRSSSAAHGAFALAIVILAGMIHAVFEDWLLAPGNYLSVFFWSIAFVFVDLTSRSMLPSFVASWPSRARPRTVPGAAPTA